MAEYEDEAATLPTEIKRWELSGAGLEALEEITVSLPSFGPNELLVRHDACGICFSDIKIVDLGPEHPRLQGRSMRDEPVVMGHEVALTVVGVGAHVQGFEVGQRFVVQPDVYYHGTRLTYGYQIDGGMAQYGVVPRELLQGDEGCYLVPVAETTGYAEAALVEPWACVVAAYAAPPERKGLLDGGKTLIVNINTSLYGNEVKDLFPPGHQPTDVVTVDNVPDTDFARLRAEETADIGFDDIVIYGTPNADDLGRIAACLGPQGILNLVQNRTLTGTTPVDVGRVHYDRHQFVGTDDPGKANAAYTSNTRTELKPGGTAWFVGAGGPLGQMHVQRALLLESPPRTLVVTDLSDERLERLRTRFGAQMKERGIALHLINPTTGEEPGTFGPYDDIVCLAPSAAVIEESIIHLAEGGVYNVFAGLARGTTANLELGTILVKNQRIIGTSGSSIADLRHTLELAESHSLSSNASVAAIGGLDSFREALDAVREGRFPGKTVIFPQIAHLPLLSLNDLQTQIPAVFDKMQDGKYWTAEAEQELLKVTRIK